jgi:hypothetical protein
MAGEHQYQVWWMRDSKIFDPSAEREEHDPSQRHSSAAGRHCPNGRLYAALPRAGIASSSQAEPDHCLSCLTGEALASRFRTILRGAPAGRANRARATVTF